MSYEERASLAERLRVSIYAGKDLTSVCAELALTMAVNKINEMDTVDHLEDMKEGHFWDVHRADGMANTRAESSTPARVRDYRRPVMATPAHVVSELESLGTEPAIVRKRGRFKDYRRDYRRPMMATPAIQVSGPSLPASVRSETQYPDDVAIGATALNTIRRDRRGLI